MSDDRNAMMLRDSENRTSAELRSLDRLFESVFGQSPLFGFRHMRSDVGLGWSPAIDIRETDNELIVYAALPGLSKEDVTVEVKDNTLILSGKMKALGSEEDSWIRREFPRGEFYRAFSLSADVQVGRVSASMKNGVLEIRLPKAEEARPRKIVIA